MNIILTGASRGIGYQTALELCKHKIDNLFLISRNREQLEELKGECILINKDVNIVIVAEDISNLTSSETNLETLLGVNSIDVLINNAGTLVNKSFKELTDGEMQRSFEVNVFAPSRLIKKCLPLLEKPLLSHVINISSMGGFQGSLKFPGLSYYSSSKAAIACLTECLAEEYKETNIRFNCLALGAVQTEMLEEAFPGYKAPVTAQEMGAYVADFALNGHRLFNGKILPVTASNP